jgi:hypothetical protein
MATMIVPRIGALLLLIAYGFGAAQIGRLMYVVASEGFGSWVGVALLIAPAALVGLPSAALVLFRKPLGLRLALPLCAILAATALITLLEVPPVAGFLDDYEAASLARGVELPPYQEAQGVTAAEFVDSEAGDVRFQGGLGALILVAVYFFTVVRRSGGRFGTQPKTRAQSAS